MTKSHSRQRADEILAEIDEIEVRIEKLVEGGDGFARFVPPEGGQRGKGIPIFVPRSAPGDRLRVRLVERRAGYGRAEILEILAAGEGRRDAPCPYFDRCGGCDLQHLEENLQLKLKAEAVRETLRRLGGIETLPKVTIVPGQPWGYRLRAQLHLQDAEPEAGEERGEGDEGGKGDEGGEGDEGGKGDEGGRGDEGGEGRTQVGYFTRGSHELVPVARCGVLVPELESALGDLPQQLGDVRHRRIDLTAGDDSAWTVSPPVEGLPQGEVTTRVGDFVYAYDGRCFFQTHRQLIPALVEHALGSEEDEGGTAYDLFAGVGLFSLPLARRYGRVIAVESDRIANRFARKNAKANGVGNITIERQSVDSWLHYLPPKRARVLVDPPRLGLSHKLRRALVEKRPRRLTYVSCNAATLARDLKQMRSGFRIESLTLLDMFPQTGHMEAVVQLVDRDAG